MADYSPYQKNIINRYYDNFDTIKLQRLSELTTEIYLAEGAKRAKMWKQIGEILTALEVPATRIEHVLAKADVTILARLLEELHGKKP